MIVLSPCSRPPFGRHKVGHVPIKFGVGRYGVVNEPLLKSLMLLVEPILLSIMLSSSLTRANR